MLSVFAQVRVIEALRQALVIGWKHSASDGHSVPNGRCKLVIRVFKCNLASIPLGVGLQELLKWRAGRAFLVSFCFCCGLHSLLFMR